MARAIEMKSEHSERSSSSTDKTIIWWLVFTAFAANVYFVSPNLAGIPIRFFYSIFLIYVFLVISPEKFRKSLLISRSILITIAYLGALGVLLSVHNGKTDSLFSIFVADYVQPMVMMFIAVNATLLIGARATASAFILVIIISCFFSVLQVAGFGPANEIRSYLGEFFIEDIIDEQLLGSRGPGLSYNVIVLGNQICLAFAVFVFVTISDNKDLINKRAKLQNIVKDYSRIIYASLLFALVCAAEGNRSPLLGLAIFFCFLFSAGNRRWLIVGIALVVAGYFFIGPVRDALTESGLRVASSGDKSELARYPLAMYGFRLFEANPLGYGATFESKELVSMVRTGDLVVNSWGLGNIFANRELHNAWITALDKYGIFFFPVVIFALKNMARYWTCVIGFIPYLVHISFHNAAPLENDYMFWVPLGVVVAVTVTKEKAKERHARVLALANARSRGSNRAQMRRPRP